MPKKTHAKACLEVLKNGLWHPTVDFQNPACGSEGLRRLRELRAKGYVIEKKRKPGSAQWLYRLVSIERPLGIVRASRNEGLWARNMARNKA